MPERRHEICCEVTRVFNGSAATGVSRQRSARVDRDEKSRQSPQRRFVADLGAPVLGSRGGKAIQAEPSSQIGVMRRLDERVQMIQGQRQGCFPLLLPVTPIERTTPAITKSSTETRRSSSSRIPGS